MAAPTAGLPEQVGGSRNWDYRFTWVRDGSLSVYALLGLGFTEEAAAFGDWLRARVEERAGDGSGPLRIMYRVDGSSDLTEETLDHLDGYMGSRPVRIGNAAADHLQLDIYGEAMNSLYALDTGGLGEWGIGHDGWNHIVGMVDWLCEHWQEPDEGIWETRGGRRRFTYGQVMSWVALDRAVRMATARGRPADLGRWLRERDRIHAQVMTKGWNDRLGAFVQYEGGDVLDASLVFMPLTGFVVPNDPRWQSTMSAMDKTLVDDSLVYRYDPKASPDGLPGSEGTFSLCTFLYVDALARSGPARRRAPDVHEDADLREPPRPLLRGDRPHRATGRQLPAGLHPPRSHRGGRDPRQEAGHPEDRDDATTGSGRGADRMTGAMRRPNVTSSPRDGSSSGARGQRRPW